MKKRLRIKSIKRVENKINRMKHYMITKARIISRITNLEEKERAIDNVLRLFPEISETKFLKLVEDFSSRPPQENTELEFSDE